MARATLRIVTMQASGACLLPHTWLAARIRQRLPCHIDASGGQTRDVDPAAGHVPLSERGFVIIGNDEPGLGLPGPLGAPGLWHADPAHAVVSIVELRSADHGCEFALHTSTVELDSRARHTSLELRVDLESVACARCSASLFHPTAPDHVLRWSAAHCVVASATQPNLLVAAGTLSIGSIGRPVELVGSATVRREQLYLQVTGTLPSGALDTTTGQVAVAPSYAPGAASMTVTAQLLRRNRLDGLSR